MNAIIYADARSDWLVAHNSETGTTTHGKTIEETLANLKKATALYLEEFPLTEVTEARRASLTTFEGRHGLTGTDDVAPAFGVRPIHRRF